MKQTLPLLAILIIGLAACKKYKALSEYDDLGGIYTYTGRLLVVNNVDSTGTPNGIGGIPVHIRLATNPGNDLFDTVTDKNGYFYFRNLKADTEYKIAITRHTYHGILYDSTKDVRMPPDADYTDPSAFTIYPSYAKQNGWVFTIRDVLTGGYINNCNVYLYTSRLLADSDLVYNSNNYINFVKDLPSTFSTSNGFGKSFYLNIQPLPNPASPYIVRFKKDLGGNRVLRKDTALLPPATGIRPIDILL